MNLKEKGGQPRDGDRMYTTQEGGELVERKDRHEERFLYCTTVLYSTVTVQLQ